MPANETEPSLLQYCYDTSSNVKDSFQCLETLGTRHFRMNTWFPWIFDGGEDGDWVGLRDRPWRLLGIIMFPTNPNAAKHCIAKWGWKTRYDLSYLLICATLNWKWTIVSCPTVPALFSNEKSNFPYAFHAALFFNIDFFAVRSLLPTLCPAWGRRESHSSPSRRRNRCLA